MIFKFIKQVAVAWIVAVDGWQWVHSKEEVSAVILSD
jgi:hypothetical protein